MTTAETSTRRGFLTALGMGGQTVWDRVPLQSTGTEGIYWTAATAPDGSVFVAGDDGVILRFADGVWSREALGTNLPFHALHVADDGRVWAVGWMGVICERRDGAWHHVQGGETPDGDGVQVEPKNLPLFDVWGDGTGTVWAVGDLGRVAHFDGAEWRELDCGTDANLRCVTGLDDGTILVGGAGGTLLALRDGTWHLFDSGTSCPLLSLAVDDLGAVFAVGGVYNVKVNGFAGYLFRLADDRLERLSTDLDFPRLRRVRAVGRELILTGDGGYLGRWRAGLVRPVEARERTDLHDVVFGGDGLGVACGDQGLVLVERRLRDGEQIMRVVDDDQAAAPWQVMAEGLTKRSLRSVWAFSDSAIFAVGDAGTILSSDGTGWTEMTSPVTSRLHGVWGTSPSNVYAVGDAGTILHFDGRSWRVAHRTGMDVALLAIIGFSPHDIFAVGDQGLTLRFDGQEWHNHVSGTRSERYSLWGIDGSHVLAVGGAGTISRWNGEKWKSFYAGTDNELFGVVGAALDRITLVGLTGTIINFDGQHWSKAYSGVRADLHDVVHTTGAEQFAIGSGGTILRYDGDEWREEKSGIETSLRAISAADKTVFTVGDFGLILRRSLII